MLNPQLETYIEKLPNVGDSLSEDRKATLISLAQHLQKEVQQGKQPTLIFICTHNSRRSHMGQVWAQVFAWKKGIPLQTFSGGTEATAFNPNAIQALQEAGMGITGNRDAKNPHYTIEVGPGHQLKEVFSKKFGDPPNPTADFAAIMTCTDADEACPFVPGAIARFSLPYEDPKKFDGTPQQAEKYAERSIQIASEMKFVMEQV